MKINVHHEVAGELLEALGVVDEAGRPMSEAMEGRFSPATLRVLSQLGWAKDSDPARAHLTAREFEAIAVAIRIVTSGQFHVDDPGAGKLLAELRGRLTVALPKVEAMQDRARKQEAEDRGIDPGWPRVLRDERQPAPEVVERNEARARRERLGFPVSGGRRS